MITVVMLNWARPESTLKNVRRYAGYSVVRNIFLFNNGAALNRASLPSKCVLVESSENLGVYPRLAIASLATTDAILHTDDDLTLPEASMNALYSYWASANRCCHGLYGRATWPTYQLGDVFGPVEVVLTRALLCSRRVNNLALSSIDRFDDLKARPRGNGEDIILSFAGLATSGRFNFAHQLPVFNCGGNEHFAIHRSWTGHLEHRKKVVTRCRTVFFGQKWQAKPQLPGVSLDHLRPRTAAMNNLVNCAEPLVSSRR